MMRFILHKHSNPTFAAFETFPQREIEGLCYCLLGRYVFDGAELFEPPHHIIVGQFTPFVLPVLTVCHQTTLVQSHHYIGTVHLCPQSSC